MIGKIRLLAAMLLSGVVAGPALAGVIISPTNAEVTQGGTNSQVSITNTFNQSGLNRPYVSGVTDFDSFFRPRVFHTGAFFNDWFAAGPGQAIVVYDLGQLSSIASLAFWSEDAYGAGRVELLASTDNQAFTSLGSFAPTDAPPSGIAFGDRFDFATVEARYVKLVLDDCPTMPMAVCSIGEVAFNRVPAVMPAVPEPATWGLMLMGFSLVGHALRRGGRTAQTA